MVARAALAVMARYPEAGAVKTRLARALGAEAACDLYRAFLRDIDTRFAGGRRALVWLYYPADRDFPAVTAGAARCLPQVGGDLGERMRNGFRQLCAQGFERVVMIGADVPHVRDEWLDAAENHLDDNDVVLGPSEDGGYYLIAMRAPHDLFTGVPMGTPAVLKQTLSVAEAAGLTVHLLPQSFDIDELEDLQRLRTLLARDGNLTLSHTAAALAKCGL